MCLVAIATVVSAVASVAAPLIGYAAQSQAAKQQEAYQNAMAKQQANYNAQVAKAAEDNYLIQKQQLYLRQQQQNEQSAQEEAAKNLEARQAIARAKVAAGEAGVAGLSVDALVNDYYRQRDVYVSAIRQTRANTEQQTIQDMRASRAQAMSSINTLQPYVPQPVQKPSLGAALISSAAGGANAITSSPYAKYSVNPFQVATRAQITPLGQ